MPFLDNPMFATWNQGTSLPALDPQNLQTSLANIPIQTAQRMDSTIHLAFPRSKWNVPPKDCRGHTGNDDKPVDGRSAKSTGHLGSLNKRHLTKSPRENENDLSRRFVEDFLS